MNIIIIYCVLSEANVILSTIRSITTIKSSWIIAAAVSAFYYSFYNLVIIYTVADFSLYWKMGITFAANLTGVSIVKLFEKKLTKDKLWKIEATFKLENSCDVMDVLQEKNIPYRLSIPDDKWSFFEVYCASQNQTRDVAALIKKYGGKYFVAESRAIL